MFNILSLVFRYLFILIIYLFIFAIIRMIYLDIRGVSRLKSASSYLKLIVMKEYLPFSVESFYPISGKSVRIGRGKNNDIVLPDPYISSEHLVIARNDKRYFIEDMGSANGTFLNGKRIDSAVEIESGDRIRMGQLEFLFVSK